MKVKSVIRQPEAVVSNYVKIPEEILSINLGLEVSEDVMFVKNLAFLVSVSNIIKFKTIKYTPNSSEKELARSVNKIIDVYKNKASQYILCIWNLSLTVKEN